MLDPKPGYYRTEKQGDYYVIKWVSPFGLGGCLRLVAGQVPTVERLLKEAGYNKEGGAE